VTAGGAGNAASAQRSAQAARAFAANTPATSADCSSSAGSPAAGTTPIVGIIQGVGTVLSVGSCSNVQLAGTAYLAGTPVLMIPGLQPADLQSAYELPSATAGTGQTIGIVVVHDDPNAEIDLAVYRSTFGLPACSSASGCLRVVAMKSSVLADANWSREISTDLDMASAVCPNCKLLLVEASTANETDLASAVSAAISAGANVVSNSYAIPESKQEVASMWSHPGVPIVAAAGDRGFTTANWPAASRTAIAVGATTLTPDATTSRGWRETAWSGTGSGCSTLAAKPSWQTDTGCAGRTVADVAAVGDPATPVAVFDTYLDSGWVRIGGTSVATPIVAGVYGLAANGAQLNAAASLYAHSSGLFPVNGGSNGTCSPIYLCTAGFGYSGPTGLGSPHGIAAF